MTLPGPDRCPICEDPAACRGYPHLWTLLRRRPRDYLPAHAILNGLASPLRPFPPAPSPGDGSPVLGVPTGCCH